jgi:hypothetical protein
MFLKKEKINNYLDQAEELNNYYYIFFLFVIFFFILIYLNPNLLFQIHNYKHFSTYHRDDIVFVYNALLYAENLPIHHLDHPSLFTYIIFSFFYRIFNFFEFINFYNLSGFLTKPNLSLELSKLFYISKLVIHLFSLGTIYLIFKIVYSFTKSKKLSFFCSIIFIFSIGFISSSNRIESGLIAIFFLFLSFLFLIKFLESKNIYKLNYLALAFLFIFSAMMQKKIVFFSIPFVFLLLIIIAKKNNDFFFKKIFINNKLNYKIFLIILYFFFLFFITYKTILNNTFHLSRDIDFLFLIVSYCSLNLVFYFYAKYFQNYKFENILTYNIIFGITFYVYKYLLIHYFSAPPAVWSVSFTNFAGQINLFSTGEIRGALEFNQLLIYPLKILNNFFTSFQKYIFSYSFQSILIWTTSIVLFYNYNNNLKKITFTILLAILGYLFIHSILLFRYEQDTYYLNSEFLLIVSYAISAKLLASRKLLCSIYILTFICLTPIIYKNLKQIKHQNSLSYCNNLDIEFYKYWTNQIPIKKIKTLCQKN